MRQIKEQVAPLKNILSPRSIIARGDSPAAPLVYPGPDRAAPGAVCRRTSPCHCRTGRARTGLPAAGTWARAGWLWPPGPATQPARAPHSSWARGWVRLVAPWWGKRPYQASAQKYSQLCYYFTGSLTCFLHTYRYFICICVLKVLLHYGGDGLLKVPLIQRGDHRLIHTVFLSTHADILGLITRPWGACERGAGGSLWCWITWGNPGVMVMYYFITTVGTWASS